MLFGILDMDFWEFPFLGYWVNKGKKKGRGCSTPRLSLVWYLYQLSTSKKPTSYLSTPAIYCADYEVFGELLRADLLPA